MHTPHLQRRDSSAPVRILAGGKQIDTRPFAKGGGEREVIKQNQVFAGRTQGGGTRRQIYGTRDYGSGYPGGGRTVRGTSSRGFPFYFWPVVWAHASPIGTADAYLHPTEYGLPDNSTRPGGALATLTYVSSTPPGSTFRILTDFTSAQALIAPLSICAPFVNLSSASPSPYPYLENESAASPLPEQTVQYYRASSIALTLDAYNNTAALLPEGSSDSYNALLPRDTDVGLLRCLNTTIGRAGLVYDPKGLGGDQIFLIVAAAILAVVFAALLGPALCGLWRHSRRRRHEARRRPAMLGVIDTVSAPPPAVVVLPLNGERLSSGKAGELVEEDDVAPIAGTQRGGTLWEWARNTKVREDIEMKMSY